jgi:excisionase family DNA binding protein
VTMREAAEILGVSKEAIRKRVIRGTLRSETGGTAVGTCTSTPGVTRRQPMSVTYSYPRCGGVSRISANSYRPNAKRMLRRGGCSPLRWNEYHRS